MLTGLRKARIRWTAVVLIVLLTLLAASPAFAHYYATGKVTNGHFLGGYAQWANPTQYTTVDSGGFTEQTLWVHTQNSTSTWVEVGLTKGWKSDTDVWTFYWAEKTPTYAEYLVTRSVGSTGSIHTYEVQYTAYNTWTPYIDWAAVGSSNQASGSVRVDVGGEVTNTGSNLTMTYPEYMQVLDNSGGENQGRWVYWKQSDGTIHWNGDGFWPSYPPFYWQWRDGTEWRLGSDYKSI